jgi:hypothetical protein
MIVTVTRLMVKQNKLERGSEEKLASVIRHDFVPNASITRAASD